jgi:hypothetical protein
MHGRDLKEVIGVDLFVAKAFVALKKLIVVEDVLFGHYVPPLFKQGRHAAGFPQSLFYYV